LPRPTLPCRCHPTGRSMADLARFLGCHSSFPSGRTFPGDVSSACSNGRNCGGPTRRLARLWEGGFAMAYARRRRSTAIGGTLSGILRRVSQRQPLVVLLPAGKSRPAAKGRVDFGHRRRPIGGRALGACAVRLWRGRLPEEDGVHRKSSRSQQQEQNGAGEVDGGQFVGRPARLAHERIAVR
jgi:hypothetical protein